jgi:hypothetical protein
MSEHDSEHEGGKPPPPAMTDEDAGDKGLGTEAGVSEAGDDVIDEMPEARGEVRYPDEMNPEGPPRTPKEGEVVEKDEGSKEGSRGADTEE